MRSVDFLEFLSVRQPERLTIPHIFSLSMTCRAQKITEISLNGLQQTVCLVLRKMLCFIH